MAVFIDKLRSLAVKAGLDSETVSGMSVEQILLAAAAADEADPVDQVARDAAAFALDAANAASTTAIGALNVANGIEAIANTAYTTAISAQDTANQGLKYTEGGEPGSPRNGDTWYNTGTGNLSTYVGGAWLIVAHRD